MSEKQSKEFERLSNGPEKAESTEQKQTTTEAAKPLASQAEQLREARELASEQSSEKGQLLDKLNVKRVSEDDDLSKRPVSGALKKITFRKEIWHIRQQLGRTDRLGSKIIHQPIIRTVSEVSSKTITRPSGLLGGGITAFIGTSTYLYLTKHIGLKYNYSIFLFLLIAGFIVGLLLEAVIRLARGRRSI